MNFGSYKKYDVLNGIGLRHSIFLSGCTHKCKGCFNEPLWDFSYGEKLDDDKQNEIINDLNDKDIKISGLSILGGEPFDNADDLTEFVQKIRLNCKNSDIWIWSGYTFEQILKDEKRRNLLKLCDVLVDGKFEESQKDMKLKFRGSRNQRIVDVKESFLHEKCIEYII